MDGEMNSVISTSSVSPSRVMFTLACAGWCAMNLPYFGSVRKRGIGRGGFGEVYFAATDAGKELAL